MLRLQRLVEGINPPMPILPMNPLSFRMIRVLSLKFPNSISAPVWMRGGPFSLPNCPNPKSKKTSTEGWMETFPAKSSRL